MEIPLCVVAFPLLLLIFTLCVSLVWLICVLGCFALGLSCLGLCVSWTWVAISFPILGQEYLLKYFLMPFLFVFFFWDSYDSNVGMFNIAPEVTEVVLISFNFFLFSPLFHFSHHSIFHLTYPFFCLSYSTVGSLQSAFDLLLHYSLLTALLYFF